MSQTDLLEAQEQFTYTQVSTQQRKPSVYTGSMRIKITIPKEDLQEELNITIQNIEAFFHNVPNHTKETELTTSKEEHLLALYLNLRITNVIDINTDGSTKQIKKVLMDWFMDTMKIYPNIEAEVFVFNVL